MMRAPGAWEYEGGWIFGLGFDGGEVLWWVMGGLGIGRLGIGRCVSIGEWCSVLGWEGGLGIEWVYCSFLGSLICCSFGVSACLMGDLGIGGSVGDGHDGESAGAGF